MRSVLPQDYGDPVIHGHVAARTNREGQGLSDREKFLPPLSRSGHQPLPDLRVPRCCPEPCGYWTSLNPNIATVDALGRVVSKAVGVALITAACGDKADTVTVQSRQVMASVSVSPSLAKGLVGDTLRLAVTPADSNGIGMSVVDVTWSTANLEIATVSATGVVRGLEAGSVQVTATSGTSRGATTIAAEAAPTTPPPPPPSPTPGATAELPRVYLETAYRQPTGQTIRVAAGESLQAALVAALPGDQILLQAGATFRGNFKLPKKEGNGWVTIRTDGVLPAEGTRATPTMAAGFAKLVSPNSDRALQTELGAARYRIMGVEITMAPEVTSANIIVGLNAYRAT